MLLYNNIIIILFNNSEYYYCISQFLIIYLMIRNIGCELFNHLMIMPIICNLLWISVIYILTLLIDYVCITCNCKFYNFNNNIFIILITIF